MSSGPNWTPPPTIPKLVSMHRVRVVYFLPMLIYPKKWMKDSLPHGAQQGTVHCQDKSWMYSEVFREWLPLFISVVKPMSQEKFATNFKWIQQSRPEYGCYWNSLQTWSSHAVDAIPQHVSNAATRCHILKDIGHIHGSSDRNVTEGETRAKTVDRIYCAATDRPETTNFRDQQQKGMKFQPDFRTGS
jgi:hypothetical protein